MNYKDYRMKRGRLTLTYFRPEWNSNPEAVQVHGAWYDPNGEVLELPQKTYHGGDNELDALLETYRSWFVRSYPST